MNKYIKNFETNRILKMNLLRLIGNLVSDRLSELGVSKYAFCKRNGLSRPTLDRIMEGKESYSIFSLFDCLDGLGLELKIVKRTYNIEE